MNPTPPHTPPREEESNSQFNFNERQQQRLASLWTNVNNARGRLDAKRAEMEDFDDNVLPNLEAEANNPALPQAVRHSIAQHARLMLSNLEKELIELEAEERYAIALHRGEEQRVFNPINYIGREY